jgi:hypothetical protein
MSIARPFLAAALTVGLTTSVAATEVWSGRTLFFEKPPGADWTQPENQDRITDNVWITRAALKGIFNIAQEEEYFNGTSPVDTEWATGDAVDYESLEFQAWEFWHDANPPSSLGVDAVVHLITDDIYIDIRLESWSIGPTGGGFSYFRSPGGAVDVPIDSVTWANVKAIFR